MAAVLESNVIPFAGELLDADGHMYLLPEVLEEITRGVGAGPNMAYYRSHMQSEEYARNREQNRDKVWSVKGLGALGAWDAAERVEALDLMGIRRQLLFPNTSGVEMRVDSDAAREVCRRYNDVALEFTRRSGGRAVAACQINTNTVPGAMAELERVLAKGAGAVTMPCHAPPAGVSPAHSQWDPFWARIQEADIPATIHLGGAGLLSSRAPGDSMFPPNGWGNAESLKNKPALRAGGEEAISPYFMLIAHYGPEIFLQTLVMGKVFERFPRLRFGIIECAAAWVGPVVERMDLWADFMNKVGVKYDMKPSEYVRRNVRVTPFFHENLPQMIERYGLDEVWVFNTDYPHLEGSRDPIGKFMKHLSAIGRPGYDRAFFVDNGRLLFPGT